MDYRVILKSSRTDQGVKVTQLLDGMDDVGLYSSSYSRVEALKQHLDLPQFFEVCRVLKIDPGKLWLEAKAASDFKNLDLNNIYLKEEELLPFKIKDDAMTGGPQYSICQGSTVWYKSATQNESEPGNLVVISDAENNLYIRLLINDMGIYKLKAWQTEDFETLVLQTPYKVVGIAKDVTFKAD